MIPGTTDVFRHFPWAGLLVLLIAVALVWPHAIVRPITDRQFSR
jgi:hypothetical protein